jgi:hypothetical protein
MSPDEAQHVWDAIVLHAAPGIAEHRSPECALVHWRAGIDVLGVGADLPDRTAIDAVRFGVTRSA